MAHFDAGIREYVYPLLCFARLIHLDPGTLHAWETDEKMMFKKSWEKYFKDIVKV